MNKYGKQPARERRQPEEERVERGFSRPPLARMLRMHEMLAANSHPNCRKLAEEFEVSTKTVQRDVNFMRDQMGLPMEYDKRRFGFYYTRPVNALPGMSEEAGKSRGNAGKEQAPAGLEERPLLSETSGRGMAARIRFDRESARAVRRRIWHATQELRSLPDGGVEMTLRARDELELARWVLSWAGHAWVLEPARLRSRVREVAREILARH
jgi:predicted DNA-binding transcriptional regulator YafY